MGGSECLTGDCPLSERHPIFALAAQRPVLHAFTGRELLDQCNGTSLPQSHKINSHIPEHGRSRSLGLP